MTSTIESATQRSRRWMQRQQLHAKPGSVHEAVLKGQSEWFEPQADQDFTPTQAMPGTREKLAVLRRRVDQGLPLWHPQDLSLKWTTPEWLGHRVDVGLPDPDELMGDEW